MPIVGVPGWIGSSAVSVTGQRWMSAARTAVQLPAAGSMSQMAGRSKEVQYSIGANHNYNKDTLINYLKSQGATPVVVTITGDLVSSSSGVPCLDFPSSLTNSYISLVINAGVTVYGRGGNGGSNAAGAAGGNAINNGIGTRLRITNNGAIAGGGGGGGGGNRGKLIFGGGGGRPFGAGGSSSHMSSGATAGTISAPGKGSVGEGSLVHIQAVRVVMSVLLEEDVILKVTVQNITAEQLVKLLLVMLQLGLKLGQFTALMCKYLPTKCGRFMI